MSGFYRVERSSSASGLTDYYTVVFGHGEDATEIGSAWKDHDLCSDICDLMNDAFEAGQEHASDNELPDNAEEVKLVAFFRSPEGDALGRAGDYDNLSPAATAIRTIRTIRTQNAELLAAITECRDAFVQWDIVPADRCRSLRKMLGAAIEKATP